MSQELIDAISQMKEDEALKISEGLLSSGVSPLEVFDWCREAMEIVGKRFEAGEYYVPELILAGEVIRQG